MVGKEPGTGNAFFEIQMISAFAPGIVISIIVIAISLTGMSRQATTAMTLRCGPLQAAQGRSYLCLAICFIEAV